MVDDGNVLLGRITIDDVVDIIRDQAEHQALGAAGLDSLDDAAARQELTGRAPRWGRLLRKVLPRIERAAAKL